MDIANEKNCIEIFCCYARQDQPLVVDLKKHLKLWERQSLITLWTDTDISPGTDWEKEIARHLNTVRIILFFVSPDFLASEYCYSTEMKHAMKRYELGEVCVIPIILRHCAWEEAPFGKIQALPTNAEPVVGSGWYNPDEAFTNVAKRIRQVVESLSQFSLQKDMKASFTRIMKDNMEASGLLQSMPMSSSPPHSGYGPGLLPINPPSVGSSPFVVPSPQGHRQLQYQQLPLSFIE